MHMSSIHLTNQSESYVDSCNIEKDYTWFDSVHKQSWI